MPSADIHALHLLTGLVAGAIGIRPLVVPVEKIMGLCHRGIVHVAGIMPYTVFLGDTHMAHLHRQEVFQDRLPYTTVVHILVDAEDRRFEMVIDHLVEPGFLHVAEVGSQVLVT